MPELTPPAVQRRTNTTLDAYTGSFGRSEVLHLLRRTLFGFDFAQVKSFESKSLEQAIDTLLTAPTSAPTPPLNNYSLRTNDPNVAFGDTWVNAPFDVNFENQRKYSLKAWLFQQTQTKTNSLHEKMSLFWHHHFSTETLAVNLAVNSYAHHILLRTHAFGNFKSFVRAITIDSAMLDYLNGRLNTKRAPDENYARELQELFTLGKGPDSQYTEDDVKAMARVLTGWTINFLNKPYNSAFVSTNHDSNDKLFSSFYGNTILKGQIGATAGDKELNDMLDMLFSKDTVIAKHICRKLYRMFVYYDISSDEETKIIEPLAQYFIDQGWEIKPVLKKLFMSEHFFDNLNRSCIIKDPISHLAGFLIQTKPEYPTNDVDTEYSIYQLGRYYGELIQLDLGDPPNVSGWPAWYQTPMFHRTWMNADTFPKRNQFCDFLLYVGYVKNGYKFMIDVVDVALQTSNPSSADDLIADLTQWMLAMPLTTAKIAELKAILLPGGIPDYNWSDAWYAANDPTNSEHTSQLAAVKSKLQGLLKTITNLAEYQLS